MFGFFAFNGGSQANISKPGDGEIVARAMINTMLSGAVAALTVLFIIRLSKRKKWSLLITMNAALTGMVSVCAGCDAVKPWASCVVGLGGGLVYILVSFLVEQLKVDDPLDAVAVHAGGGLWGVIAAPFLIDEGIFFKWDKGSGMVLAVNLIGAVAIIVWSGVLMGLLFMILRLLKIFRVSPEVEEKGLDIFKHGEPAYPLSAYGHGWDEEGVAFVKTIQNDIEAPPHLENVGTIRQRAMSKPAAVHPEPEQDVRSVYGGDLSRKSSASIPMSVARG